jgi:predicted transcriptional regulator
MATWSFLTSHARVLLVIDSNPDIRLREIAASVGITERRAYDIVADLASSGYLDKRRAGRRNVYEVRRNRPLGEDLADHRTIGDVLTLLTDTTTAEEVRSDDRAAAS